jgi:hypothetical protein
MKPLDINENSECYKKIPTSNKIEQIKNQIKGKKFRNNNDVVETIENFTFQYLTYSMSGSFGRRERGILVKPQETPNELVIRWDIITDKNNYNTFSSIYKIPKSLEDFLKAQIPVLQLKDLPDCFFEIRRVKRQKTDFIP